MNSLSSAIQINKNVEILIVEDNYLIAISLQEILEAKGYTVVAIADSAQEAIEKASNLYPNLILMNISLQGKMNGMQAAIIIHKALQIPTIFVTGYYDKNTLERLKLTYSFDYVLKPFTQQELYMAIEATLAR